MEQSKGVLSDFVYQSQILGEAKSLELSYTGREDPGAVKLRQSLKGTSSRFLLIF